MHIAQLYTEITNYLKKSGTNKLIFNLCKPKVGSPEALQLWQQLLAFDLYRNSNSMALNYCWVAAGRYDGVVALTKDTFAEYAGALIVREADGKFTNSKQDDAIKPADRFFVAGNEAMHRRLMNTPHLIP